MTHQVVLVVVVLALLTIWALAIASILRHQGISSFERGVWVVVVVIFPVVGTIAWAAWGSVRRQSVTRQG